MIKALSKLRLRADITSESQFLKSLSDIKAALESISKASDINQVKREHAAQFFDTLADIFLDESRDVNAYSSSVAGLF